MEDSNLQIGLVHETESNLLTVKCTTTGNDITKLFRPSIIKLAFDNKQYLIYNVKTARSKRSDYDPAKQGISYTPTIHNTSKSQIPKLKSRLTQINNVEYSEELFQAHKTDTPLDGLFSIDGGVPKATNWMIVGDPGVGKSTVTLDIISNAQRNGSKVLFISAEMNQVDLYLYVDRYPKFGELDIFFPQELEYNECPRNVLNEILDVGYDIVLIDSLIELQETIRENSKLTKNSAEKWLLDLMYKHNLGNNNEKRYTTFLNIQQVNKGGTFVGSNKLKHMTTGMMEIRFVTEETPDERYVVFTKNRRGYVGKQMFFDLSASGDVTYDTERFKKSEEMNQLKKKEKELIKEEGLGFDKLFGINRDQDAAS